MDALDVILSDPEKALNYLRNCADKDEGDSLVEFWAQRGRIPLLNSMLLFVILKELRKLNNPNQED